MARKCSPCQHVKRAEIDRRLAAGEPGNQIAHDYELNPSSLHRHRCRDHHWELHRHGNELAWWANVQIAPLEAAKRLWQATRSRQAIVGPTMADEVQPLSSK
jgi:hypothetical protein